MNEANRIRELEETLRTGGLLREELQEQYEGERARAKWLQSVVDEGETTERKLKEQVETLERRLALCKQDEYDAVQGEAGLQKQLDELREEIRYAGLHTQQPIDLNYVALLKDDWESIVAKASSA